MVDTKLFNYAPLPDAVPGQILVLSCWQNLETMERDWSYDVTSWNRNDEEYYGLKCPYDRHSVEVIAWARIPEPDEIHKEAFRRVLNG